MIVAIGSLVAISLLLMPPYTGTFLQSGDNLQFSAGHHWVGSPPKPATVRKYLYAYLGEKGTGGAAPFNHRLQSQINTRQLFVQLLAVVFVTAMLCWGSVRILSSVEQQTNAKE